MGMLFFFFQAEDGIRDLIVTGVQTCALPISARARSLLAAGSPGEVTAGRARNNAGSEDQTPQAAVMRSRSSSRGSVAPFAAGGRVRACASPTTARSSSDRDPNRL